MQIKKGTVSYQGSNDWECLYGEVELDGKPVQYYFMDNGNLPNGNFIASTHLVEAIDREIQTQNVGMIDSEGNVILPFEHKSIKVIPGDILLVEKSKPTSESVLEAIELKKDPLSATKLVSTPAAIKEKMNVQLGADGRYLFNDQFSEASIFDFDGKNLINDEYFSFVGIANNKLFFTKNIVDAPITEYSIFPAEVRDESNDVENAIDIQKVADNQEQIEQVIENEIENKEQELSKSSNEIVTEENVIDNVSVEIPESHVSEENIDTSVSEDIAVEQQGDGSVEENVEMIPKTDESTIEENVSAEIDSEESVVEENKEDSITGVDADDDAQVSDNVEEQIDISGDVSTEFVENTVDTESKQEGSLETEVVVENDLVSEPIIPLVNTEVIDNNTEIEDVVENVDESVEKIDESVEINEVKNEIDENKEESSEEQDIIDEKTFEDSEVFGESILKTDSIETDLGMDDGNETIMDKVMVSLSELIEDNRKKQEVIENQDIKNRSLLDEIKYLKSNLEEKEKRLYDTEKELAILRAQTKANAKLLKLLDDANTLLGKDHYTATDNEGNYTNSKAA